jgi:hypothetical protein
VDKIASRFGTDAVRPAALVTDPGGPEQAPSGPPQGRDGPVRDGL